jgi:formylglycine-generating enzyme required for sulfatase activity
MNYVSCVVCVAAIALASDLFGSLVPDRRPIGENGLPMPFTNSVGMKFVWIPPGTFVMGSPKEEKDRQPDETQHRVTLTKGFYMGVYPVTQEQWQGIMGSNPSEFKGKMHLPVEQVSWNDCQAFIKKLQEKDKKQYRLPSEAEWEFCCRAGTTTPYYFGEAISTDQANFNGESTFAVGKQGLFRKSTIPVGSFPANRLGLHDMQGNVWQWCQDWHGEYSQKDMVNPQGPDAGPFRELRGGSWINHPRYCRSASRLGRSPDLRSNNLGFRVCFFVE